MLANVPLKTMPHGDLTIEGYSRAAVQTCWRIPELRVGFDLGVLPFSFVSTPNWFVSHCHLDHAAAVPTYVATRRLMKMSPPRVFLPAANVEHVQRMLNVWRRLDGSRMACELIGLEPGQEYELFGDLIVTAIPTQHTVPCLGYVIWQRRRKLKPEFLGLPGDQIRDLRLSGTPVTDEVRVPLVAYLGDTSPEGLDSCDSIYHARILITELTFVDPRHRRDRIHKHGHLHLDDLIARADRFQNEIIVAGHFTARSSAKQIERQVNKLVPEFLRQRLHLWL